MTKLLKTNEGEARNSQIVILSILLGNQNSLSFGELLEKTELHTNVLSKWLERFKENGFVINGEKKYWVTEKGKLEYKRLLSEENVSDMYNDKKLMYSLTDKGRKGKFNYQVALSIDGVKNDNEEKEMTKDLRDELIPIIANFFKEHNTNSGAATFKISKEIKK